jgi:RNA polymerase-binding transcription factor DksA
MNDKLINELQEKLEEQKKSVQAELESFAEKDPNLKDNWDTKFPNREDGDKDEAADDATEYDNKLSVEHSLELKLRNIKSALEKIKNGTYGICEKCGKKIDEERLLACPEAKTCLKCHLK